MWKKLPNLDLFLFLDIVKPLNSIESTQIKLYFTDYNEIWSKFYNELEFMTTMQSCNTILEMDAKDLFNKGLNLLSTPEDLKKVTMKNMGQEIEVNMLKSFGFPVKLTVHATNSSKDLFYQKVTYPLLATVRDLKTSQQELCALLVKKDEEIKEYKAEGGQIALRHLKTPKFDEVQHISSHPEFSKHFAFTELPEFLTNRAREVAIKEENPEHLSKPTLPQLPIKTEQSLQPHASQSQVKEEPESQAYVKQEILSQNSQVTRKRPRKLNNL